MLYRPSPSEVTVRTFSMRAGLVASAVTPGNTPPDASRTTPAIPLACWAHVARGSRAAHVRATRPRLLTRIRTIASSVEVDVSRRPDEGFGTGCDASRTHHSRESSRAHCGKCRGESAHA